MRKLILSLVAAIAALAVAGRRAQPRKVDLDLRLGLLAQVGDDHERRHGHLEERGQREPPGARRQGPFVSPIIRPEPDVLVHVPRAGTYTYKDELHPKLTGKLVVKGLPPPLTLLASAPIVTSGRR